MKRHAVLALLLVAELALFAWLEARQLRGAPFSAEMLGEYLRNLLVQSAPLLCIALGMTLVLATAGIDLSAGAMSALVAAVMARCTPGDSFWLVALPVGLAAGLLFGATNGLLVARCDLPPIIATLGTMVLYRGLCYVTLGDREWATFVDVPGYRQLASGGNVLVGVILLYGFAAWYLNRSRWLAEVRMLGGNHVAARYAGIRVERRTVEVYAAMGVMAWLASLATTSRNLAIAPSSLIDLELQAVVAVVLGGTRVQGGSHTFLGTLLAALLLAVLDEGLRGVDSSSLPFKISHTRYLLTGALLLVGVWLNMHWQRRRSTTA